MNLVKYKSDKYDIDSVAERKQRFGENRDIVLLTQCNTLWENLRPFRRARARAIRFTYGDQLGGKVRINGKEMTEREHITKQGNVALQTNQIKKIVTTIAGAWTKEKNEPICYAVDRGEQTYAELMSTALQVNWRRNKMSVLMGSCVEEALIGGLCIARECYEKRGLREDAWTDICNPNYMFFDAGMKDPRFSDMSCIGEIHDISFNELCNAFAESPEDFKKLREYYTTEANPLKESDSLNTADKNDYARMNFYTPYDTKLCRVFEVWTKERRPMYKIWDKNDGTIEYVDANDTDYLRRIDLTNKERLKAAAALGWNEDEVPIIEKKFMVDTFWYYRFLTPTGYILAEGESDAPDRSHPYSMLAVPFTNGKIVSHINDAIDQNIAINRILTLDDMIRRMGAKGITFVPQNIIPDDMDYKTFAEQWTSIDGIVYYKPNRNGDMPKTFYGQTGNLNTAELVRMMNDLMQDSVSVSGAVQGKSPTSGTSAALYSMQTQNSTTPMALFFEKFNMFVESVAIKKTKYIKANYDTQRFKAIAGNVELDTSMLNLDEVGEIEYDLAIKQSTETPVNRMLTNDWMMQLAQMGGITVEDILSLGMFPGSDKLLQRIEARNQQMAGLPPQPIGQDYEQKKRMLTGRQEGNA